MAAKVNVNPVVSKIFCSSSQAILVVRRRPHVVNGGGLVVTDCSQQVIFRADGCGILGKKEEIIIRDGDRNALLLIRRKEGMVEALGMHKHWKGYSFDYEGSQKLVFVLKEPHSCLVKSNSIKINMEPRPSSKKRWDFEIQGYFPDRNCSLVDSNGNIIAQVGVRKEVQEVMGSDSKDLYQVVVKPGIDQAFVFGVIAILDYIYDGSTKC